MKTLRNGYTTGSCVAAGAVAAFRHLVSGQPVETVILSLPGSEKLTVPVMSVAPGEYAVIKDAGDDPDVTDRAEIRTLLEFFDGVPGSRDYVEACGEGELVISCGGGVGVVTRPGLTVPVGHWAVNPGPRRILVKNLAEAGFRGRMKLTITVPAGEELAVKTLNKALGIEGGISILGNSGIVRPYSNAAYAATVALQLRQLSETGVDGVVLVTGNRTAEAAARDYPELAAVRIGDFIEVALRAAKLKCIVVGCMPGKLFKYACGEGNTHAHKSAMLMSRLAEFSPYRVDWNTFRSMGEVENAMNPGDFIDLLECLKEAAQKSFAAWNPASRIEIALYNDRGERYL